MKIESYRDLPIKAEPIDDYYGLKNEKYDVREINMGQSSTSINLMGFDKVFNSVHFKYYLHNREIDIYRSGLINPYMQLSLPMICFKE